MQFANSLIKGTLIQRYKRFLADVELEDGQVVTAHCANSGSMLGLKDPGSTVYLSPASGGKLAYRWEIVEVGGNLVCINTSLPNKLVQEALENQFIPAFKDYPTIRREVKYGTSSRVDFLLESPNLPPCYLEVKSVITRRSGTMAEFPDAVTARGTKHLLELSEMVKQGARAAMLYVALRDDCQLFDLAHDIDPEYSRTSKQVFANGVEKYCYACTVSPQEVRIYREMEIL